MANLARTSSVSRLAEAAQSYKSRLQGINRRAREAKAEIIAKTEGVAGGALGGAIDALAGEGTGEAEVAGIPVVPVVGGLSLLAGLAGNRVVPGGEHLGNLGVGMLAYWVGNLTRDQIDESYG